MITNGSGDVEVRPTNTLDVVISGSGDIRYKAAPDLKVSSNKLGSGDLEGI